MSNKRIEEVLGEVVLSYESHRPLKPEVSPYQRPVLIKGLESISRLAMLAAFRIFKWEFVQGDNGIKIDSKIREELIYLREIGMSQTANSVIGYYRKLSREFRNT